MLLAPAVVANLIANPDVAFNLDSVLRLVMPLDWQAQGAMFARTRSHATRPIYPVGRRRCGVAIDEGATKS